MYAHAPAHVYVARAAGALADVFTMSNRSHVSTNVEETRVPTGGVGNCATLVRI